MSNFIANSPLITDIPPNTTPQTEINWNAIQNWLTIEHYPFSAGASAGGHTPGVVEVVYNGTSAQISSLSSPGSGALAWSLDEGVLKIYEPAYGWNRLTWKEFSRIRATISTSILPYAITSAIHTQLPVSLTDISIPEIMIYDSLGEWNSGSYISNIKAAGYYLVTAICTWDNTTNQQFSKELDLSLNGSIISRDVIYGNEGVTNVVTDILQCNAGDQIQLLAYHTLSSSNSLNILSASINFSRLS